jgi:hypothetical protein
MHKHLQKQSCVGAAYGEQRDLLRCASALVLRLSGPQSSLLPAEPATESAVAAEYLIFILHIHVHVHHHHLTDHSSLLLCNIGVRFFGGGGSSHDKLPELAHRRALEKSLRVKDQSCPVLRSSHKTVW